MTTTHTPGPWWFTRAEVADYYVAGAGDKELTDCISRADAQLIAAAPDLLEALRDVFLLARQSVDEEEWNTHVFHRARAAISRATKGE